VHYYPLHLHPYYREKSPSTSCPIAEEQWKRIVTLPLYTDLGDEQVERVVEAVIAPR
jgi:perosamine synthetase